MQKQVVEHYGVHKDANQVYWLLQQGEGLNAIGLPKSDCPFRLRSNMVLCPHEFDLSVSTNDPVIQHYDGLYSKLEEKFQLAAFTNPLVKPEKPVLYVNTTTPAELQAVAIACSLMNQANGSAVNAAAMRPNLDKNTRRLNSSNMSLMYFYGAEPSHTDVITRMSNSIAMNGVGRIVVAGVLIPFGKHERQFIEPISLDKELFEDLIMLGEKNVRKVGSLRLKKFMRV